MPFSAPEPLQKFFGLFPLHTYPAVDNPYAKKASKPTLWILPPLQLQKSNLSSDVECLKWQAYLALRGIREVELRWDISPEAGVGGHLPTLQLSTGKFLSTDRIPMWADTLQNSKIDPLEGFIDEETKNESRPWITLMEGVLHAELEVANLHEWDLKSVFHSTPRRTLESILCPPPAPLSGISSPFPVSGTNVPVASVHHRYREAIQAISDRLGDDKWFLGSSHPTALDALLFAYLYSALHGAPHDRQELEKRQNLITWEARVRILVAQPHRHQHHD